MTTKNTPSGYALIEVILVLIIMTLLTVLVVALTKIDLSLEPAETRWNNQETLSTSIESATDLESSTNNQKSLGKPTFSSSYQTSTSNQKGDVEASDIKIEITPLDLAERKIDGIKVDLATQGLPTPNEVYAKINATEEKSVRDWSCQLGPIIICQGPTVLVVKAKSTFDLFFTENIDNAPANLAVDLLENGNTVTTLSVPLQNP